MTKASHDKKCNLKIYDPRIESRFFNFEGNNVWDSKKNSFLSFETENYSLYSNGEWVTRLLKALVSETATKQIVLAVRPGKAVSLTQWFDKSKFINNDFFGFFDIGKLKKTENFFNEIADFGTWNFYGLNSNIGDGENFKTMPEVLADVGKYRFFVEIDLDGMLLGLVQVFTTNQIETLTASLGKL